MGSLGSGDTRVLTFRFWLLQGEVETMAARPAKAHQLSGNE